MQDPLQLDHGTDYLCSLSSPKMTWQHTWQTYTQLCIFIYSASEQYIKGNKPEVSFKIVIVEMTLLHSCHFQNLCDSTRDLKHF